jgi:hypothetical protein
MTKYSLKNICLGIGIGLIIASMANINTAPKKLSIDEIKREAEQYNLIVINAQDMIKKEPEQQKPETQNQTVKQTSSEQSFTIVIESGATSDGIAEKLYNSNLVNSKQEFLDRLRELKKESKVQIGSFNIPKGSSLDKIIDIITSSPK